MLVRWRLLSAVACALALCGCAHDGDLWFPEDSHIAAAGVSNGDETYPEGPPVIDESATPDGYPTPLAAAAIELDALPVAVDGAGWGAAPVHLAVAEPDGPYLLDTGDRLRIFVYGQPNLSRQYTVDHDGRIAVPLIGDVGARGKTTRELQGVIRSRLGAKFVKDPQVTVDVQQNRPFFIYGEVRSSGQYPYVSGMTIETAIAIAGGFTERASDRAYRVTWRSNGLVQDVEAPGGYSVRPGDTVYVFERFF